MWATHPALRRADLDRDSEPCVEMDVDLQHGATTEAIANEIARGRLVMTATRDDIGQGD